MSPIEKLPHTADLRFRVTAASPAELFRESLRAMTEASEPAWAGRKGISRDLIIQSPDRNALLVDFLSEALRLGDTHDEAYTDAVFEEFTDKSLKGHLLGRRIGRVSLEIKAATYHELDIRKNDGIWETNLVFDI